MALAAVWRTGGCTKGGGRVPSEEVDVRLQVEDEGGSEQGGAVESASEHLEGRACRIP